MPERSRSDKPRMPSSERQAALTRLAGGDEAEIKELLPPTDADL